MFNSNTLQQLSVRACRERQSTRSRRPVVCELNFSLQSSISPVLADLWSESNIFHYRVLSPLSVRACREPVITSRQLRIKSPLIEGWRAKRDGVWKLHTLLLSILLFNDYSSSLSRTTKHPFSQTFGLWVLFIHYRVLSPPVSSSLSRTRGRNRGVSRTGNNFSTTCPTL